MKKALIVYGGWDGHEPEKCAKLFAVELKRLEFDVDLANDLAVLNDLSQLRAHDLIVPIWSMGQLTPEQERNLEIAVREGTGLAGFHGGMGDAFRNSPLFQFMVGGQFVAHPGGISEYVVHIRQGDTITEGLKVFTMVSEQYYMHVDPSNEVLATTTFDDNAEAPWVAGCVMPVAWKRHHGLGKVFYCSLGHVAADFKVREALLLTLRGMFWAAR